VRSFKTVKVVCFGGGTGLPALLSGLRENKWLKITAAPTVFDNGGSSGALKDSHGILPPGDVLRCLLSLSEDEAVARKILSARIEIESAPRHTAGNLLLLGLQMVFENDYQLSIDSLGTALHIHGRVCPVSCEKSTLVANYHDGVTIKGEIQIDEKLREGTAPKSLSLDPQVEGNEALILAIKKADILCISSGSFFTSILPCFLPKGIKEVIQESPAPAIFISNILTEGMGMNHESVESMTRTVEEYIGKRVVRIVINDKVHDDAMGRYAQEDKNPTKYDKESNDPRFITGEFWQDSELARHDSRLLGSAVSKLIHELTNPSPR